MTTVETKFDVPVLFGISCSGAKQDFYMELPQEPDRLKQDLAQYGEDAQFFCVECIEPYGSEVDKKLEEMISNWVSDGLEKLNERLIAYYNLDDQDRSALYGLWACDPLDVDGAFQYYSEVEYIPYDRSVSKVEFDALDGARWDELMEWLGAYVWENYWYIGNDSNVSEQFLKRYLRLDRVGQDYWEELLGGFWYDPDSKVPFFIGLVH